MKKTTKFTRLLALVLVLTFLVGSALTVYAANGVETDGSTVRKSLAEIKEQLNAISYEEYLAASAGVKRAQSVICIDAKTGYTFQKGTQDGESERVLDIDGISALYTPGAGTVSWQVTVPEKAKYSIIIEYWPDDVNTAAIERILMINGEVPFAQARFLTLPKVWKNQYTAAKVCDPDGKVSIQQLYEEALAAGFNPDTTYPATENGETYLHVEMPAVWTQKLTDYVNTYTVRFMVTDIDNNEIRPAMSQTPEWLSYELRDADGFYAESFEFVLEPDENGKVTLSLEAVNEAMAIKQIWLVPHEDLISYEDYMKRYEGKPSGSDKITIQAEYAGATSTQTVYPIEDRTDAATVPADTNRTVLNTIGGEKWATAGQWIRYTFTVNTSGMYNIAARYRQNVLDGMYVCRAIRITSHGAAEGSLGYYDGGIPFKEASQIRFNYDSRWQSSLFNDGSGVNYQFYFEKGVQYEIRLEVALGSMGDLVRRVEAALDAINNDYLAIMKLTGSSPDEYRDYGFSRVMPDTLIDMVIQSRELYAIAAELERITGEKSSNVATLERVAWLLERMGTDEDEIAKYLEQLKSYIGSLGTWLGDAKTQPLELDYLVVQPLNQEPPKAKAGFFASFLHEIKSFIMSFFRNYDRMGATAEDVDSSAAVDVWLATGRDQAQVLRNLINNDFTPNYNVPVNLKLVAGGTLLPSVLSGMGPDVYIGLSEDDVINYAIRGALEPIENMEGFADFALHYKVDDKFQTLRDENGNGIVNPNAQFNEAAMLVLGIEDAAGDFHYYGLPETQSFTMMFVRDDILADLGIEIPRTWDDILEAVPILQANNMQIGMHQDYKIFLYQMGGELFADDGMRINLDSNVGLEAFETMCSFFTMYSFPKSFDFANRFRTGEMPIGFASYTATYNHLTVFASEIKGLWEFVQLPGIEETYVDANGVERTRINNMAVSTVSAIVMLEGCDQPKGAWDFMTWHVGADCQSKYANEMVAIIGPSAKHSTANRNALASMPWTAAEREQILYQFNKLASIPNYPGSYIIGRYTTFAFLAAYEDNADPVTELQSYITTINKEITRKRQEFGLETLELGQTLAEKRLSQVQDAFAEDTDKMSNDTKAAAAAAIDMMNDGIRDKNSLSLRAAKEAFLEVDANAFARTIAALEKAIIVLEK